MKYMANILHLVTQMLEEPENRVGLLLNLPVEVLIYFQEQSARLYLYNFVHAIVVHI